MNSSWLKYWIMFQKNGKREFDEEGNRLIGLFEFLPFSMFWTIWKQENKILNIVLWGRFSDYFWREERLSSKRTLCEKESKTFLYSKRK
jgi:hypothetical protein